MKEELRKMSYPYLLYVSVRCLTGICSGSVCLGPSVCVCCRGCINYLCQLYHHHRISVRVECKMSSYSSLVQA